MSLLPVGNGNLSGKEQRAAQTDSWREKLEDCELYVQLAVELLMRIRK